MRTLLYEGVNDPGNLAEIIDFDPDLNRWGDVWSIFVPGVGRAALPLPGGRSLTSPSGGLPVSIPRPGSVDPYWQGPHGDFLPAEGGVLHRPSASVMNDEFDWQGDRHLHRGLAETIIFHFHVRGFTRSHCSESKTPARVAGIVEKIPYLKSLGVTAID